MNTKEIGRISKEYREDLGLSVNEVAKKINRHKSNVYRFENGELKDPKGYVMAYSILGDSNGYLSKVLPLIEEVYMNG